MDLFWFFSSQIPFDLSFLPVSTKRLVFSISSRTTHFKRYLIPLFDAKDKTETKCSSCSLGHNPTETRLELSERKRPDSV